MSMFLNTTLRSVLWAGAKRIELAAHAGQSELVDPAIEIHPGCANRGWRTAR